MYVCTCIVSTATGGGTEDGVLVQYILPIHTYLRERNRIHKVI